MEQPPFLPRPTLPIGATGAGSEGRSYEVLAAIDRGGMGELFLARVRRPGQKPQYAVLKRLLADLLDDDKYIAMFRSEAQVMSELDHPNIVRVIDMPKIQGRQCLAMEHVRGRNVQQMLGRAMELGAHMPAPIALAIMIEVLKGLDYAHRHRMKDGSALELVHRDVTPGNVLVSFEGDVKLTDFGIAKSKMSLVSTTVGIVKGKARYLSPEQILGEPASPKSDIFSAAAVTCEMLTGVPAFDRGSVPKTLYAIVNGEMPDLDRTLPFRAPLLIQTLKHALAPKPAERIGTAKEFADALQVSARTFGPAIAKAEIGKYLGELFEDVEDPLADFFEEGEAETVHGFKPAIKPPPLPKPANGEVHEDEEPTAATRNQEKPKPRTTTQAVDEALSVLAFLQSQSGTGRARLDTPSLRAIAVEAARGDDAMITRPAPAAKRPGRSHQIITFALGAVIGSLMTFGLVAIFEDPEPADELELIVDDTTRDPPAGATIQEIPTDQPAGLAVEIHPASLDVIYPRGARVRIDGRLLPSRVPIKNIQLEEGLHAIKIWKGKYRREIRFESMMGARYVLNRKLTKRE